MEQGESWERACLRLSMGIGVGARQVKPSLLPGQGCRHGWARQEMPLKETGLSRGRRGGGGRAALAKDEPERLGLLPNPFTHALIFLLNGAKKVYFLLYSL